MLAKIRIHSKKLLHRRKLRSRFYLKNNNASNLCRLVVHRSAKHLYAQVIDDVKGMTLAAYSTVTKDLRSAKACNIEIAQKVGAGIAQRAKEAGVTKVIFDRSGRAYHGKIKALADAARENGLEF